LANFFSACFCLGILPFILCFASANQTVYDVRMKRVFFAIILLVLSTIFAVAQQRPLLTDDVDITPPGSIDAALGVEFTQNEKFAVSGLKGDLTKFGQVKTRVGLSSNVELQVEGTLQNYLAINSIGTSAVPLSTSNISSNDTGDFIISTKIKFRNESKAFPAVGLKLGFVLPNSDQSKGIGVNQINVFGKILLQKRFGKKPKGDPRANIYGNLGIGIFPAPTKLFTQNDMFLYGLAGIFRITNRVNLATEINGRLNTRGGTVPLGTESYSQLRVGSQIKVSGLRFDTAALFGLTKFSPRTGVTFGVTYTTPSLFKPAQ
jgi:hypothetical protein